jgi:triacylglycerol lipase
MAYAITANVAPVPACPPYDRPVGFAMPPTGFVSGPSGIDACLVGTNDDGVILAFRGTLPPDSPNHEQTFKDWLNDVNAVLVSQPKIQGKVHKGFWNAVDALWPGLVAEVQRQLAAAPGKPLYVTGHSKGGAMADLAAVRFALAGISNVVCTFAGAHPGNSAFAKFFDGLEAIASSTRYEYTDDIVPHLPPGLALRHALATIDQFSKFSDELATKAVEDIDYAPVGTLRFIDWNGNVVGASPTLPISRAAHLAELVASLRFDQIVHDHTIECGGGYAKAICPTGVCP